MQIKCLLFSYLAILLYRVIPISVRRCHKEFYVEVYQSREGNRKKDMNSKFIADLPSHCIEYVLEYLSSEDLKSFGLTCKRFKTIANIVFKRRSKSIFKINWHIYFWC